MERYEQIERTLITTYRKKIWNKFTAALKEYKMIQEGDRIAICISGGKDSMLLAKCMQKLEKFSDVPFTLEYIVMDPGYHPDVREKIVKNAEILNIPIKIFDSNIFKIANEAEKNPCYLCARMRRGHLYEYAESLGCNKIALGHHFDDAIETILLSILYGSEVKTMMPKLHSTNHKGMELIRPLFMVRERDIIAWANHNDLSFIQCACLFTEQAAEGEKVSKRFEVKELIRKLEKDNKQVPVNIFRSFHNVSLDAVIGYQSDGMKHSFLDDYDKIQE